MPHDMDCEIFRVVDASGGSTMDGYKYAIDRMVQVGVVPTTWSQVLLVTRPLVGFVPPPSWWVRVAFSGAV